jgi:hypothetical protein
MVRNLTLAFMDVPWWFVVVGLIVSAYHGYRGYVVQRWTAQSQKHDVEQRAAKDDTTFKWFMSSSETIAVRYVYDALFYFFCSIAGFAALWLATSVFNALPNIHDIPGGTGALLVFLVVLGLLGVSGILPHVIQLGKLPR